MCAWLFELYYSGLWVPWDEGFCRSDYLERQKPPETKSMESPGLDNGGVSEHRDATEFCESNHKSTKTATTATFTFVKPLTLYNFARRTYDYVDNVFAQSARLKLVGEDTARDYLNQRFVAFSVVYLSS